MADETADTLREMALHRGLKLMRSRRRKAGTGDFGKFGLLDAAGQPLLGIGEDGLTASAGEIEAYLRAGATSTWAQSAELTPDRQLETRRPSPPEEPAEPNEKPSQRSTSRRATPPPSTESEPKSRAPPRAAGKSAAHRNAPGPSSAAPSSPLEPDKPKRAASPPPAPELAMRAAKPSDAAALATLLSQLAGVGLSEHEAARHLAALRKSGGGVDVAELGPVIGCVAWAIVPTLQRGPMGRITVLIVDDRHRRRGIGKDLLARAEADLAKKGCMFIEVVSDTDLKNSHGFFRTLDFEQKSYRFVRAITRD